MLRSRWLGRVPYHEALALQQALSRRAQGQYLILLEHPHVYTLGVNADEAHVLVDPASVGATLARSDRGGDVTYHGPGQLVVYPIVDVPDDPGAGPAHVHDLEDLVVEVLDDVGFGRAAGRLGGFPGIWIDPAGPSPRKLAAIGVRTTRADDGRRRTLHGVAINIDCDLSMFTHIVPCGIEDLGVTSMAAEGWSGSLSDVLEAVVARATVRWGKGQVEHSGVVGGRAGSTRSLPLPLPVPLGGGERPLLRRLRQSGTDPDGGLAVTARKPEWLRLPVRMGEGYRSLGQTVRDLGLVTVCEEAGCPNIFECWAEGTATFMINGSRCTRACGFCLVDTRHPGPLDPAEPSRVAEAVDRMGLAHAVITCVARDDLADGGAAAMAATVEAIRSSRPETTVEVLISDCKGDPEALERIFDARPDVLNHNIETVARLQRAVRPSAGYARSLSVLARAAGAGLVTKSGMMVGLGETVDEVASTLADLSSVGVTIATIGQYLRPTRDHLPVARWWEPAEFDELRRIGSDLGLVHVEASPLTRSSYHARSAAQAAGAVPVTLTSSRT